MSKRRRECDELVPTEASFLSRVPLDIQWLALALLSCSDLWSARFVSKEWARIVRAFLSGVVDLQILPEGHRVVQREPCLLVRVDPKPDLDFADSLCWLLDQVDHLKHFTVAEFDKVHPAKIQKRCTEAADRANLRNSSSLETLSSFSGVCLSPIARCSQLTCLDANTFGGRAVSTAEQTEHFYLLLNQLFLQCRRLARLDLLSFHFPDFESLCLLGKALEEKLPLTDLKCNFEHLPVVSFTGEGIITPFLTLQKIFLETKTPRSLETLFNFVLPFPELRSITLTTSVENPVTEDKTEAKTWHFPILEKLDISGISFVGHLCAPCLRTLKLGSIPWSDFFLTLGTCPRLALLSIELVEPPINHLFPTKASYPKTPFLDSVSVDEGPMQLLDWASSCTHLSVLTLFELHPDPVPAHDLFLRHTGVSKLLASLPRLHTLRVEFSSDSAVRQASMRPPTLPWLTTTMTTSHCVELALDNVPLGQLGNMSCPFLEVFECSNLRPEPEPVRPETVRKTTKAFLQFLQTVTRRHNLILCSESAKLLASALSVSPVPLPLVDGLFVGECAVRDVARLLTSCHNIQVLDLVECVTDVQALLSAVASLVPSSLRKLTLPDVFFKKGHEKALLFLLNHIKDLLTRLEFTHSQSSRTHVILRPLLDHLTGRGCRVLIETIS